MGEEKFEKIRQLRILKNISYKIAVLSVLLCAYFFLDENFQKRYFFVDQQEIVYEPSGDWCFLLFLIPAVLWFIYGKYILSRHYMKMYGISKADLMNYRNMLEYDR